MNFLVLIGLFEYLYSVSSENIALTFGKKCEINNQCQSQNCVPICNSAENACIEPDYYYIRHDKQIPTCIKPNYVVRNVGSIPFSRERQIGHSCHHDKNCVTKHCLPMCESSTTMWRCIEPRSFFEREKLDMPICAKLSYVTSHIKEGQVTEEVKKQAPLGISNLKRSKSVEEKTIITTLGQLCSQHSNCLSSNCVSICESPKPGAESRCIEPRMSFTMYNLPIPKCINREAMDDLVKLVDSSIIEKIGTNNIEEVIWKRLHLLSTPDVSKVEDVNKSFDTSAATANVEPKSDAPVISENARRDNGSWLELYSVLRGGNI